MAKPGSSEPRSTSSPATKTTTPATGRSCKDGTGNWQPSPFYDIAFSPSPHGEHTTAFLGHGGARPLTAMQRLAAQANFAGWPRAREAIERVVDALQNWPEVATELGIRPETRRMIGNRLDQARGANKALLA